HSSSRPIKLARGIVCTLSNALVNARDDIAHELAEFGDTLCAVGRIADVLRELAVPAAMTGKAGPGAIVAIVSGGNIDLAKFCELISPSA
nr:hypothetical protein [Thermoanaerobaculia bacterium]